MAVGGGGAKDPHFEGVQILKWNRKELNFMNGKTKKKHTPTQVQIENDNHTRWWIDTGMGIHSLIHSHKHTFSTHREMIYGRRACTERGRWREAAIPFSNKQ